MGCPNARAGPSQTQRPSRTQRTRAEGVLVEEVPEAAEEESDEDEEEEGGAGMAMDVDDDDPRSVRIKIKCMPLEKKRYLLSGL